MAACTNTTTRAVVIVELAAPSATSQNTTTFAPRTIARHDSTDFSRSRVAWYCRS